MQTQPPQEKGNKMKRQAFLKLAPLSIVPVLFCATIALAADEALFDLKKVTDGVYIALARPAHVINSNAAIIILDDGVLVVDTHSKISAARALIEQIKTITDKPVRYVVDSHFHYDHFQGNGAYHEVFPGAVEIIASEPTREGIVHRGIPRIQAYVVEYTESVKRKKARLTQTTDPEEKAQLERDLAGDEEYLHDMKNTGDVLPTMSFEKSLILHRGDRTVQILFLGRGHTDGDTIVFLPKERIICTGDLVHGWGPYMPDSHPYDWIKTLAAVERLAFDRIISGHGDVMQGKSQVTKWKNYIKDLMNQVEKQYAQGHSVDEIKRTIDLSKHFLIIDRLDQSDVSQHVEKAYREISWQP